LNLRNLCGFLVDVLPLLFSAMRRIPVFFYGLFMDADLLRAKGADPASPRRASVPGFSLRIGQRATLVEDDGGKAHGIVMDLSRDEIEPLYADPSVNMYRPEAVVIDIEDGARRAALCYTLTESPRPGEANAEYAAKLRDLAQRLGLPADYVERIG
jgi:hypothetical protein